MAAMDEHLLLPLQDLSLEENTENKSCGENHEHSLEISLVEKIKEITGYEFTNPNLLQQAFTHYTYLDEDKTSTASYERLEYMGDAVLGFYVAKEHYTKYPDLPPGQLTKLRAANVDKEKLARVALKYELHTYLRHKKPLLAEQIKEFEDAIGDYPLHSSGLVDAPKTLGDVVESLVGAIYIDSNSMDTTSKILENLLQPMITPSIVRDHPVSMLHEICQKNKLKIETRDMWEETGEIIFIVDGEFVGQAKFKAKRQIAKFRAAENACRNILSRFNLDEQHDYDDEKKVKAKME